MSKEKEVAKVEAHLPELPDPEELREILQTNFGGLTPSFAVIKIPAGGSLAWEVPGLEEEPFITTSLQGVVIDHYPNRVYWREAFDSAGGKQVPTCSSLNAIKGSVERNDRGEFGDCATCKWAKFGSGPANPDGSPSKRQACNLRHRVFMVLPDYSPVFPMMISLSTMSTTTYMGSLATYGRSLGLKRIDQVITRVKLTKDSRGGKDFSKAQFFFVADLSDEEKTKIASLKKMFAAAMRAKPIDVEEEEETTERHTEAREGDRDPWEK